MVGWVDTGSLTLHVRIDGHDRGASAPIGAGERGRWQHQRERPTLPALLFLHSLGSDLRIWDGVVARLPDHACLRLDLLGHGLSDVRGGDDSVARIAEPDTWQARPASVRSSGLAAIADEVVGRWFAPATYTQDPATVRGCRNLLLRTPAAGYLYTCAGHLPCLDHAQAVAQHIDGFAHERTRG